MVKRGQTHTEYRLDTILSMDEPLVELKINERGMRAVHSAVCFTLEKWTGQEEIDQEQLLALKPFLQGCVFEFDFARMID